MTAVDVLFADGIPALRTPKGPGRVNLAAHGTRPGMLLNQALTVTAGNQVTDHAASPHRIAIPLAGEIFR